MKHTLKHKNIENIKSLLGGIRIKSMVELLHRGIIQILMEGKQPFIIYRMKPHEDSWAVLARRSRRRRFITAELIVEMPAKTVEVFDHPLDCPKT